MTTVAAIAGRLLLSLMFIFIGFWMAFEPASAAETFTAAGLPATYAVPVGVFQILAGLLLAIGFMTRLVAILLAVYTLLTILFFHNDFADPVEGALAIRNTAVIGGLLMVFAYGQMRWTYDHWRERDRTRKAELRAAHAEGKAEALGEARHTTVVKE